MSDLIDELQVRWSVCSERRERNAARCFAFIILNKSIESELESRPNQSVQRNVESALATVYAVSGSHLHAGQTVGACTCRVQGGMDADADAPGAIPCSSKKQ